MDLGLEGKITVVTGASKGIGLAIVQQLVAEGAEVVAGARSTGPLNEIEHVTALSVDLATADGPRALVAHAIELHGRVDVLVNNVGRAPLRTDGFLAISDADFQASMELNFFAAVRAIRAAVADMVTRSDGVIVNVASVNAFFHPDGGVIDYGAAKAHLSTSPRPCRRNWAPRGSGSTPSPPARSKRICGSGPKASPQRPPGWPA